VSKPKPVDPKVFELAQLFLPTATEAEVSELATDIQTVCDDHVSSVELHRQADTDLKRAVAHARIFDDFLSSMFGVKQ
jgi:hypothetical protein